MVAVRNLKKAYLEDINPPGVKKKLRVKKTKLSIVPNLPQDRQSSPSSKSKQEQPPLTISTNIEFDKFIKVSMSEKVEKHFDLLDYKLKPREFLTKVAILKYFAVNSQFSKEYLTTANNQTIDGKSVSLTQINAAYKAHITRTNYIEDLADYLYINLARKKYAREDKLEVRSSYWLIQCGFLPSLKESLESIKPEYIKKLSKSIKSLEHYVQYCDSRFASRKNGPGGSYAMAMLFGAIQVAEKAERTCREFKAKEGRDLDINIAMATQPIPNKRYSS